VFCNYTTSKFEGTVHRTTLSSDSRSQREIPKSSFQNQKAQGSASDEGKGALWGL